MGRRRLSSIADYSRALRNGYGLGTGTNYCPWLRAQDVPSRGRSSKPPGIKVPRIYHLLSDLEYNFFLYAEFNPRIVDIREQFPLFPLDLVAAVAVEAGLQYPVFPKSKEPAVLTTDFLLTLQDGTETTYLAVAAKTADDLADPSVLERLEIERLWWETLAVDWQLVTDRQIDRTVTENLAWLSDPLRGRKLLALGHDLPGDLEVLMGHVQPGSYEWGGLVESLAAAVGFDVDMTSRLLRAAAWLHYVIFDLSSPIERQGIVKILSVPSHITEGSPNVRTNT